ncbi:MAG: hypothetical protein KC643_28680 [Nitrospira sp.]|nr:hypothetical protein [Nitrospira sp.]
MAHSPYLNEPNRLAEVISAIQVMGTYKFYKLEFSGWADRISGDSNQADHWKKVFEEHPEFFRLDAGRGKASLVWRRTYPKNYDVDQEEKISRETFFQLSVEQKARISRSPLSSSDISTLISAAVQLHSRALDQQQDKRWWISGLIGLLGVILGAVLQNFSH